MGVQAPWTGVLITNDWPKDPDEGYMRVMGGDMIDFNGSSKGHMVRGKTGPGFAWLDDHTAIACGGSHESKLIDRAFWEGEGLFTRQLAPSMPWVII